MKSTSAYKPGHVAAFGAALSTLAVAPAAQATSVALNITPGSNAGGIFAVDLTYATTTGTATAFTFSQWNDSVGKTLNGSFVQAGPSVTLTTGLKFESLMISASASGTRTYGFLTPANHLGWIQMDLGGPGGTIHYLAAAFNDVQGAPFHVNPPNGEIPEPASAGLAALGLLALGAVEIRRRRRKA